MHKPDKGIYILQVVKANDVRSSHGYGFNCVVFACLVTIIKSLKVHITEEREWGEGYKRT